MISLQIYEKNIILDFGRISDGNIVYELLKSSSFQIETINIFSVYTLTPAHPNNSRVGIDLDIFCILLSLTHFEGLG